MNQGTSIIVRAVGISIVMAGGLWVYQLGNSEVASRSAEAIVHPSGVTPTTESNTTTLVTDPVLNEGEAAPVTASEPVSDPVAPEPTPEPTPEPVAPPAPPAGTYQSPETNDSTYTINVGH